MGKGKIVEYVHHGSAVKVQAHLAGEHRKHCLCWQGCVKFKPGDNDNCPRAMLLFAVCKAFSMVTPVWECPEYEAAQVTAVYSNG